MCIVLGNIKQRDGVGFEFELCRDATVLAKAAQDAKHLVVVPKRVNIHTNDVRLRAVTALSVLAAHLGAAAERSGSKCRHDSTPNCIHAAAVGHDHPLQNGQRGLRWDVRASSCDACALLPFRTQNHAGQ